MIRVARPSDLRRLEAIERSADALLRERVGAIAALDAPPRSGAERDAVGLLMVAAEGRAVVGFAHVVDADGWAHLEQLSVHRDFQGRGIGRELLLATMEEARWVGYRQMSLTTYRDVPWNAPFYASVGFAEPPHLERHQQRLVETERAAGLEAGGPRVLMTTTLTRAGQVTGQ